MVANTINTFISLTVQCAQCHNHKFDPIRRRITTASRPCSPPSTAPTGPTTPTRRPPRRRAELQADAEAAAEAASGDRRPRPSRRPAAPTLAELDRRDRRPRARRRRRRAPSSATTAAIAPSRTRQVGAGGSRPDASTIDRVVLWGCHDDFNDIGAGFGFPVRFKVEVVRRPRVPRRASHDRRPDRRGRRRTPASRRRRSPATARRAGTSG